MKNCQFFKQKYKQFKFAFDFNCICPYIWVTTIPENMKKLKIIAGPCLAESKSVVDETACELANIMQGHDVEFYYKASYRKANRSSSGSYEGIGDRKALELIRSAAEKYNFKSLTDIHLPEEAKLAAEYVDVLQIPAFLARQTSLITAAAETNKIVNIKKGQFMAPDDMNKAATKVVDTGNNQVWLTERGTFFGYHDLIVDMRSIPKMRTYGYPVIYDATHSVQQPSIGEQSGGLREYILPLAKAAIAAGADGIFFETHPDPANAKSDSATQLPLKEAKAFLDTIIGLFQYLNSEEEV